LTSIGTTKNGFYQFLKQVKDGEQFLAQIRPDSEKSGAAMRAAPIGFFPTIEAVIEHATMQAKLTHDTPKGIGAAVAAALMSHYFLYQLGPKKDLGAFLARYVDEEWSDPWRGKVKSKGWMSARAAATALMAHNQMSTLLQACINFSGDVDTVAAIALAAGSCSREIAQDLPEHLIFGLEAGPYGREYLIELDRKLLARYRPER
jgi:ADP-ribosylglycohydrolase